MSIRFEHVSKSFGAKVVFKDFSLDVQAGEILFVLGKSGVGKSVLLKNIVGLLRPDSGKIWIDNEEVTTLSEFELASVRRKCGMVFQQPALLDSLTVRENIAFGLKTSQYLLSLNRLNDPLSVGEIDAIVEKNLALVHLTKDILGRYPSELSYGMQKRVSLARTLAPHPSYLLFDEPTTGLDPIVTRAIHSLIQELSRRLRVTSLVVSHDMNNALRTADRILVLDRGRIVLIGPVHAVRASSDPLIEAFLRETDSGAKS